MIEVDLGTLYNLLDLLRNSDTPYCYNCEPEENYHRHHDDILVAFAYDHAPNKTYLVATP